MAKVKMSHDEMREMYKFNCDRREVLLILEEKKIESGGKFDYGFSMSS